MYTKEIIGPATLFHGDNLEVLKDTAPGLFDAILIDPPAGLNFMGKEWDKDKGGRAAWIAWFTEVMREALRCIKPGGHAFVWAYPTTSHWTMTALEDSGWEIREKHYHLHAEGMPHSYDVAKGIEALLLTGSANWNQFRLLSGSGFDNTGRQRLEDEQRRQGARAPKKPAQLGYMRMQTEQGYRPELYQQGGAFKLDPQTREAKKYMGYGTATRPACEEWILVRRPLIGNVVENVLEYGTGALNIKAASIPGETRINPPAGNKGGGTAYNMNVKGMPADYPGTETDSSWPINVLLSHSSECGTFCAKDCPVLELDRQSGQSVSRRHRAVIKESKGQDVIFPSSERDYIVGRDSEGGASRFYHLFHYTAKPSLREKERGLDAEQEYTPDYAYTPVQGEKNRFKSRKNSHPTVKSVKLINQFLNLIAPPGSLVADFFMGSGTTGVAAVAGGWRFFGVEKQDRHYRESRARILAHLPVPDVRETEQESEDDTV